MAHWYPILDCHRHSPRLRFSRCQAVDWYNDTRPAFPSSKVSKLGRRLLGISVSMVVARSRIITCAGQIIFSIYFWWGHVWRPSRVFMIFSFVLQVVQPLRNAMFETNCQLGWGQQLPKGGGLSALQWHQRCSHWGPLSCALAVTFCGDSRWPV